MDEENFGRKIRAYNGFPGFTEWSQSQAQLTIWDDARADAPTPNSVQRDLLDKAFRTVRRAAAIDTGALEGLYPSNLGSTLTIAMETTLWVTELEKYPEKAHSLISAQLEAYERLVDLMNGPWPITETVIRELHGEVCKAQDTYVVHTRSGPQEHELPKGKYKHHSNNVLGVDGVIFEYCPPDRVSEEMHRLVEVLKSEEFGKAHPVLQAAWAHYAFILVHPFADGNGPCRAVVGFLIFF